MRKWALMALAIAPAAQGQFQIPGPKFEVASIRRCESGGRGGVPGPVSPGRIVVNCISAMSLIRQSYVLFAEGTMNLRPVKIVFAEKSPGWVDSDLYTIEAKAETIPGQPPPGQGMMLGPMMQALLEERFGVKLHRENRPEPVYELVVGKSGPSLRPAEAGGCVAQNLDRPMGAPAPGQAPGIICGVALIMNGGFEMRGATMEQLCTALSGRADRKVVNKSGLAGTFDIRIDWSNGDLPAAPAPPPPPSGLGVPPSPRADPSEVTAGIQSALQTLGLRLQPAQGTGEFLVIDRVEKPAGN